MIRHHALMTLNDDAKAAAATIVAELEAFVPMCPEIRSYHVGVDAGITPGGADVAVVAEFDSVDDYKAYSAHPEHQRIITEHIAPNVASLVRSQTES
jgi:hypothetical protein